MSNPKNNPRPRQIPKQDRSRAAVAAIQEATLLVLLESGFEDWTTNAIADRAGVGIGSLYRYFTNKESIVASLTRNGAAELLANPRVCELFQQLDLESRVRFGFVGSMVDHVELRRIAEDLSTQFDQTVSIARAQEADRDTRFWRFALDPQVDPGVSNQGGSDELSAELLWAMDAGLVATLLEHDPAHAADASILDRVVAAGLACVRGERCSVV